MSYYDGYDNHTTAQYDTSWGEIASPAGSGAMLTSGDTFMGTFENEHFDEYDMEVEQEDEDAKAKRILREEQEIKDLESRLEMEGVHWEERKRLENELCKKKRRRDHK